MKNLLLCLFLLLSTSSMAQQPLKMITEKSHRSALNGQCVIDVTFPQVSERRDLNAKLRSLLPGPGAASELGLEPGQVLKIEQAFQVTYNAKGLLSVYGTGLMMITEHGQMLGAHPTKLFSGMVIDAKTAQVYSLRDLFGPDAYAKLDPILAREATRLAETTEPLSVDGHTYHCYLGKDGVTFYELFDFHALSSIEVTIPYAEAVKLANPKGPLMRFAAAK